MRAKKNQQLNQIKKSHHKSYILKHLKKNALIRLHKTTIGLKSI